MFVREVRRRVCPRVSGGAVVRVRTADVRCVVGRSGKEWDGTLRYSQRTLEVRKSVNDARQFAVRLSLVSLMRWIWSVRGKRQIYAFATIWEDCL